MNNYVLLGILAVMVVVMLVLPTITQKKRIKEFNDLIDNLSVGDEIRTIGGIIGRIVKINNKEMGKTFLLESGDKGNKTVMEFDVAAIGLVLKSVKKPAVDKTEVAEKVEEKTEEITDAETAKQEDLTNATTKKANKKKKK